MLTPVADGVLVHESQFMMSNAVVVQGDAGVLLIDAGVLGDEMVALANDLRDLGQPVVAAFSTHPHWDHVLWHPEFGEAPRYGTARCAAAIQAARSNPNWRDSRRLGDTARHRRSGAAGLARPHDWSTRADDPHSLGRTAGPDHRASGPRNGPCGAVDCRAPGSRRRRHALGHLDSDAQPERR